MALINLKIFDKEPPVVMANSIRPAVLELDGVSFPKLKPKPTPSWDANLSISLGKSKSWSLTGSTLPKIP